MNPQHRRPRSRPEFRPESLEDRALLSALVPAHPTAEVAYHPHVHHHPQAHPHAQKIVGPIHVITARVAGPINQPPVGPGGDAVATATGQGQGHQFGVVTFATQFDVHGEDQYSGAITIQGGSATLTSPTLGEIDLSFTGGEQLHPSLGGSIRMTGYASGATGPFAGYTGTFTANGLFNGFNNHYTLYLRIKLAPPQPAPATPVATA